MTVGASSGASQGWYPDPHDSSLLRWWNGTGWTEFTASLPSAEPEVQEPNTIPAADEPAFVATTSFVLETEAGEPAATTSPRLEPQTFAAMMQAEAAPVEPTVP